MLSPFRMVCGNFILPEPASYVFFYAFSNLRNLLYIIKLSIDNPESIDIFIYRLLTHNALKEYDKAFELADYLGRVSPDEASVHAFRSLIYKDMGEQENAAAELEMAKRLNPNIKG